VKKMAAEILGIAMIVGIIAFSLWNFRKDNGKEYCQIYNDVV
jgi:hypothetical protein